MNSRFKSLSEIFTASVKLGLTSFGGPTAHLGFFHHEYVRRRQWLDDRTYADLVALCQLLPGPASSQVGIGIGAIRAGLLGGITAWLGFTLPSAIILALFAILLQQHDPGAIGWIHGLKIVAAAIVIHAVIDMGRKLAPDRIRATIAVVAAGLVLLMPAAFRFSQLAIILLAGIAGMLLFRSTAAQLVLPRLQVSVRRSVGAACLILFAVLLLGLPLLRELFPVQWLAMMDSFYRAGSLVFGGGHVVLPLLEQEVVPVGWLSQADFLAGYGAAQAVPGPLFTFAAYIGAMMNGWTGAVLATCAIFLPAILLVVGVLPFWDTLRRQSFIQAAMYGVNAAVVGLLLAACYDPVWTSAILAPADFALGALLFLMLAFWKLPPWVVVIAGAVGGFAISVWG